MHLNKKQNPMRGSFTHLVPLPDLYELLIPYLTPAAYMAALRADPQMWRRMRAKKLPTAAAIMWVRLEHAMRRQWQLPASICDAMLRGVKKGDLELIDLAALAVLNGETTGVTFMVLMYKEDGGDDGDGGDAGVLMDEFHALDEAMVSSDSNGWTIQFAAFAVRLIVAGRQHVEECIPLLRNRLVRDRLEVDSLEAIVKRRCSISCNVFAPLVTVREECVMRDVYDDARACIAECKNIGYDVCVVAAPEADAVPFERVRLYVSPQICKRYLGTYNPRACLETTECACYERRHGNPWPDCMASHNCKCVWHVDWWNRAEQAWIADLEVRMTKQWRELWQQGEGGAVSKVHDCDVVKRLKFDSE